MIDPRATEAAAPVEMTLRGFLLGAGITLAFTAANVYLGLRVGLTIASSIPAAVISMAVLRSFRTSTLFENNIVQTIASAAGTLSAVIFVLPGLVLVGWWSGFPFWTAFAVCALGGLLGVMFTIPLRRALVTNSELPYPEGVAAAEVLKAGARRGAQPTAGEARAGLMAVTVGAAASAGFAVLTATRLVSGEAMAFWRMGAAATGTGAVLSLALLGAGHLVGLSVGLAMLAGLVIAWGGAVPILTAMEAAGGPAAEAAQAVWSTKVRFIGSGTIAVAALWTLGRLARPVWSGLISAIAASGAGLAGAGAVPRTDRDLPIRQVALISVLALAAIAVLVARFLSGTPLQPFTPGLVVGALAYVAAMGFVVAAICGYMAGLIGSSNSPLSGVGILAAVGAAFILAMAFSGLSDPEARRAVVAFALFVTSIVFAAATIANDNLQDLKTGQLVGATPRSQQLALIFGVLVGSLIIPPVLTLLDQAYGFAGAPGLAPERAAQALPAPQATLIAALARGVIEGRLDWGLIGIGGLIGLAVIAVDETLRRAGTRRLPPLAVGIGIYLPMATTMMVVIGAVVGALYRRRAAHRGTGETAERLGVLLASGLIVGESLFGVLLAGLIVGTGSAAPLALIAGEGVGQTLAGLACFTAAVAALYLWVARAAGRSAPSA